MLQKSENIFHLKDHSTLSCTFLFFAAAAWDGSDDRFRCNAAPEIDSRPPSVVTAICGPIKVVYLCGLKKAKVVCIRPIH